MPVGTESIAILRKNVVLLWAAARPKDAPRKGAEKAKSKIKAIGDLPGHRIGVIGRTKVNVTLLHVILRESGVDPDKVEIAQFSTEQVGDMVKDAGIDAFMTVGPIDSKITAEAITSTARVFAASRSSCRSTSPRRSPRAIPQYESEEIPGSSITTSPARPDDTVETVGVNHLIVAPKTLSETTVGDA